jgi:hypothetical protein
MAIPLTFLEAANGKALAKTLTPTETISYPRVKRMNSHSHFVGDNRDGLEEMFSLFQRHSAGGHAFLKGTLRKPLENESRAGQTDKFALTQLLVIDIDGLPLDDLPSAPFSQTDVEQVARRVLHYLPEPLQNVSFIAHAGSSFGVVQDRVSMHLIFMLARPVGPEGMKEWLIQLNFENEQLRELLSLTPQNMSIKYIIDPVLANNSHLLFIAHPTFRGRDNPFTDDADRWALIDNGPVKIDLIPMLADVCPQQNKLAIDKRLNELRKDKGLQKFKPKMRTVVGMNGEKIRVVSNPDAMRIEYAYENDEFVYFNINGGDSNAYFCPKHNPDIIYNFKNEPPFELSRANPALYEWYIDKYAEVIRERSDTLPVVFRDFASDKHYAVLVDPAADAVTRMAEIQKANLDDWMAEQGRSIPDPIPTWDIEFNPQSEIVFDPYKKRLNKFQLSPMMRDPQEILPQYHCTLGTAGDPLKELCPTISKIIWSICGAAETEYEYFLNWLAAALQLRRKLSTAWVFSGVPGTGKGLFYDHILRPMIGENYARKKRIDHLEDKFDAHMAETLFVVFDEFRLADARDGGKTLNKIKDEIAAETGEVRAMRQESVTRRLWANYLFFSNHNDTMRIEEGDRRFNIAPPQMTKLQHRYPEIIAELPRIEEELPRFASFMMNYAINEQAARTCLENEAKERMKENAMGWHEQYCLALRRGDLDYFIDDLMEASASSDVTAVFTQNSAKKIVMSWINDALNKQPSIIPVPLLHDVYNALAPQETTRKKFATMLGRNDIAVQKIQHNGVRERGIVTTFFSKSYTDDELAAMLEPTNRKDLTPCQPTTH